MIVDTVILCGNKVVSQAQPAHKGKAKKKKEKKRTKMRTLL